MDSSKMEIGSSTKIKFVPPGAITFNSPYEEVKKQVQFKIVSGSPLNFCVVSSGFGGRMIITKKYPCFGILPPNATHTIELKMSALARTAKFIKRTDKHLDVFVAVNNGELIEDMEKFWKKKSPDGNVQMLSETDLERAFVRIEETFAEQSTGQSAVQSYNRPNESSAARNRRSRNQSAAAAPFAIPLSSRRPKRNRLQTMTSAAAHKRCITF